jgi:hypothetical protein
MAKKYNKYLDEDNGRRRQILETLKQAGIEGTERLRTLIEMDKFYQNLNEEQRQKFFSLSPDQQAKYFNEVINKKSALLNELRPNLENISEKDKFGRDDNQNFKNFIGKMGDEDLKKLSSLSPQDKIKQFHTMYIDNKSKQFGLTPDEFTDQLADRRELNAFKQQQDILKNSQPIQEDEVAQKYTYLPEQDNQSTGNVPDGDALTGREAFLQKIMQLDPLQKNLQDRLNIKLGGNPNNPSGPDSSPLFKLLNQLGKPLQATQDFGNLLDGYRRQSFMNPQNRDSILNGLGNLGNKVGGFAKGVGSGASSLVSNLLNYLRPANNNQQNQ